MSNKDLFITSILVFCLGFLSGMLFVLRSTDTKSFKEKYLRDIHDYKR